LLLQLPLLLQLLQLRQRLLLTRRRRASSVSFSAENKIKHSFYGYGDLPFVTML
jgi:hypothetical protein